MPREKICAYCGGKARTDDHVVPDCLYPASKRSPSLQLLTVPACKSCNKSFQADEECFRNFIVAGGGRSPVVDELFFGKVRRSLNGLKGREKRAWLISLLRERATPSGLETRIYPDRRVMRIARKIVRGLSFYHLGSPVPDRRVWADVLKWDVPAEFMGLLRWYARDAEVFRYGYAVLDLPGDGDIESAWILIVYGNRTFIGIVGDMIETPPSQK